MSPVCQQLWLCKRKRLFDAKHTLPLFFSSLVPAIRLQWLNAYICSLKTRPHPHRLATNLTLVGTATYLDMHNKCTHIERSRSYYFDLMIYICNMRKINLYAYALHNHFQFIHDLNECIRFALLFGKCLFPHFDCDLLFVVQWEKCC